MERGRDQNETTDDDYTPEEIIAIAATEEQREAKYNEILGFIAKRYGYGELSTLDSRQLEGLHSDANEFLDRWAEDAEMEPDLINKDDLQLLLKQHFELGEQILDIDDGWMQRRYALGAQGWRP
jgi:hypothetical protein